jgi:ribonuclease R
MKERILDIFRLSRDNALTLEEVYKKLSYSNVVLDDIKEVVLELVDDKKIICVNSNNSSYMLNPLLEGIIFIRRNGDIIVNCDDKDIKIKESSSFKVYNKDKVLVKITDFNTYEGVIKEIIERHSLIGEIITIDDKRYVLVKSEKFLIDIDDSVVDGTLVGVKLDSDKNGRYYHANVDKVLGHKNAPRIEEIMILYENGFPVEFSDDTLKELDVIASTVELSDIEKRCDHDLRDKIIFTIDGDDTKDIDDAISIEILPNNNYLLGVHIADVSHYIKEGSLLDQEASERATSVYMPGVVSPMYPPYLSNGICSLNPKVERLAVTCLMEFDKDGNMKGFDIFKSVINSRIQMTYKNVNKILEEGIIPDDYKEYVGYLYEMKKLYNILKDNRNKRGMMNFDTDEIKINTDIDGNVESISKRVQRTGEALIEYFMLAMNECVATYINNMNLYSIYRIHEEPSYERLSRVTSVLKTYGENIDIKGKMEDPKYIQSLLDIVNKSKNKDIYTTMVLRCMAKAKYSTSNLGHYGLGINAIHNEAYTHVTSPIRRYPDTMIHRILTMILNGDYDLLSDINYLDKLSGIAKHSSMREKQAESCERDANKIKMASYMEQFVGEEFKARIVSFTFNGMFVQLENLVEGRVGYETMNDFYNYNEDLELLIGERKKKKYRLGDTVLVILTKSDKESREIDFEIVGDR